jgi:hypothetical protein
MTEEGQWHSSVVAIVVHPSEQAVWIPDDGDPLLRIEADEELPTYDVEPLLKMAGERWSLQAIVLRFLEERIDRDRRHADFRYLLMPRTDAMPKDGHWQRIESLNHEHISSDPRWNVFLGALHDLDTPSPSTRRPWSERGWIDAADSWAVAALQAAEIPPDHPFEQLRTWGLSTVNRYRTPTGIVYFKAAAIDGTGNDSPGSRSLLFANEAVLLPAFSARFPGYVPHPIAVDVDKVWMLLPDAGPFLGESRDVERWEAAIRIHARHQREMLGQVAALRRMSCLDRGLTRLAVELDDLALDSEAMAFLEPAGKERFHAAIPKIKALITELAMVGMPDTFTHGDLHPWNIGVQDDGLVFFDWTDACITHPFLDLASFLGSSQVLKDVPDARDRLRSAYLDEWLGLASTDALERSADLAEMVSMAHQAVSYQHMIRSLEGPSRIDMGGGIPYWLRRLLDRMA